MAEPGDEHRIVDRRRDGVAAPGQQRGRDGAAVAVQHGADPRVDRIAQALHEGGIAQRPAAGVGRRRGLDRAHDEAGGADAGKIHVAAEIVAARPQRRQRRQQPRLQLDKAADGGRRALAHRQPHPLAVLSRRAGSPSRRRAARSGRCARGCRGSRQSPKSTPNTSAAPARHARPARSSRSRPQSRRRRRRSSRRPEISCAAAAGTPPRRARSPRPRPPAKPAHARRQNRTRCRCRRRPAPRAAAARRRPRRASHARNVSTSGGQAAKPDGAKPPACAAPRGGQVPAKPCVRALPCSAIGYALRSLGRTCNPRGTGRLPEAACGRKAERMQNP